MVKMGRNPLLNAAHRPPPARPKISESSSEFRNQSPAVRIAGYRTDSRELSVMVKRD